jgi:pimeloyl-ACP methyl ester carboxylesterase
MTETAFRMSAGREGPVVLVHGWATDARVWGPLMARLRGRVATVAVDLPGHGDTDLHVPPESTVSEAAVNAFVAWCEELEVHRAPMVAWAWGSQILVHAMSSGRLEPASVLLVSHVAAPEAPDPYSGPLAKDWPRYARSIARLLSASPVSVDTEMWLSSIMFSSSIAAAGDVHAHQPPAPGAEFALPRGSRVILGERDRIADPTAAAKQVRGWGGEVVLMEDVGHLPFLEKPDAFERELLSWLAPDGGTR